MRRNGEKSPQKSSLRVIDCFSGICHNHSPEMSMTKLQDKSSFQGAARVAKRERIFELSLPTLVNGVNALGSEFHEQTELSSISSQKATFRLNSPVTIGSNLSLSLKVPKTLLLENQLKLKISGRVVFAQTERNGKKKQLISIQLDKNYRIQSFLSRNN